MKHAYLISAFNNRPQLEVLLALLDDERNDVYLQIDSKGNLSMEGFSMKKSNLFILEPFPVYWGGFSFIKAILGLLRASVQKHYHYYHLITGSDLPLVSQDAIHDYLEKKDREFVDFMPEFDNFAHFKAAYYHGLVETAWYRNHRWLRGIGIGLVRLQALFGVDRSRKDRLSYRHGSTYFSITHDFAEYILDQEPWIRKHFQYTLAGDEVFLQTLVMQSPFKDRLHDGADGMTLNLRHIDWGRRDKNSPYTFRTKDFEELVRMGERAFFARKFNREVDGEIIELVVDKIRRERAVLVN
jgi:hypothetical protein